MAHPPKRYFLVERYVPSTPLASLATAAERLSRRRAEDVRHLCTVLLSGEDTCLSVFEAPSAEDVATANRLAEFPLDRIVEVSLLTPAGDA